MPDSAFGIGNFPGASRHRGGVNVVFCDGHAVNVSRQAQVSGTAPDPCFTGPTPVSVYNFPYDFNGIPGVIADP